jgi:hypothetical protein
MAEWWWSLGNFEKIYWGIAMVSTLLFLVILLFTFIGGDMPDDLPDDFDGGGAFQFFTFRNMVGFFTLFAWSGIACLRADLSNTNTVIISVLCGLVMMSAMAGLFYLISNLTASGSLEVKNAIGAVGEVYLNIGPRRTSIGKVQVKVQGTLREMDALTDENEELLFGNVIRVTGIINDQILLVEKLKS